MTESRADDRGVPIRPETLSWAMRRAGAGEETLAKALGIRRPDRVRAWLAGSARPTHAQTHKIARKLDVPFSTLLTPPPSGEPELPLPDFRRGDTRRRPPSPELEAVILDALRKRDWYREYRSDPNPRLRRYRDKAPDEAATLVRSALELSSLRRKAKSWSDFRSRLRDAIEEKLDVLVLLNSIVGNDTHRPLDQNEFSGFALADPIAPLIFVNTRGSVARSIFTLAHELGHVVTGEDALDSDPLPDVDEERERFSDRFAAELLMPRSDFRSEWSQLTNFEPTQKCLKLAEKFRVSARATLVRARELGVIDPQAFARAREDILLLEKKEEDGQTGGGGDFRHLLDARNSKRFVKAVFEAAGTGDLTYTYAARLLHLLPGAFAEMLHKRKSGSPLG
ncbi:MAG: ImmA/IrrE family metallo-endopeptidase [Geminicoccaceae bacterium]|nr:ImmA/IrrE family metallo-endopeptidase [Geminicoccaceae bacterium]